MIEPLHIRFEIGQRCTFKRYVGVYQRGDVMWLPFFNVGLMRKSFCFYFVVDFVKLVSMFHFFFFFQIRIKNKINGH